MKTLLYCPDLDRANIIKGHLESEGIHAEVINQVNATPFPYPAPEREGIRILVDDSDFERAARIVESVYPPEKILCPFCHSGDTAVADVSDINPLQETIRRIFHGERQKYVCRHCGRTFYKKV